MPLLAALTLAIGPGLGGWLVSLVGAAWVIVTQAITFVVSAVSLIAIRTDETPVVSSRRGTRLRTEIAEGLDFVSHHRVLRAIAVASSASNFAFALSSAVTMIFMARTLALSPTVIGLVIAAGSVTVMIGAALTPRISTAVGSGRIIWAALAVTGPFTLLVPLARPGWTSVVFLVVGLGASELGQIIYAITNVSLRQRICPDHLLGRVNATMRFLIMGAFPVGGLLGGVLGELTGLRATLWASGLLILLSPVPLNRALRGARDIEDLPSTGSTLCR
jgi:Na+/melibiose symporter-like transporter